jgi:RNA 2',3'-cyclic 3'-phosphodiesterase
MKRIFIAIDIVPSPKLKEDYELVRYRMRLERINWVQVDNLHITLNFLGDTEEEMLPDIMDRLQDIANGKQPFGLTLRSFGVFSSLRDPRVIWIGCDPCPELVQIKKELDYCLSGFGFVPENRAFSPHLTLGRVKAIRQQNQLAQLISLYKEVVFQKQPVDRIVMYESKLTPEGAAYIPLQVSFLKSPK